MKKISKRVSQKQFDKLDTYPLSRIQYSVYRKLFKESSNALIEKICKLDKLLILGEKEYSYGQGKKDYDGNYTSKTSLGLIKNGQAKKLYLYFGLCFWTVILPNAPQGFFIRKLKCSPNFLKRNKKQKKIRDRFLKLAETFPSKFKSENYLRHSLLLLASCCIDNSVTPSDIQIKTSELNKLIRASKKNAKLNKSSNLE